MDSHFYCVIMAGGIGSRFWPVSRAARPKQFLDFGSGQSFLQATYQRFEGLIPAENIIVVTLVQYRELVKEELPSLPEENLLCEPYNRNTAPCLAYATYVLLKRDPQAIIVATPSDHLIVGLEMFRETVRKALGYASTTESLITLGIVPTRADTNFGYIQVKGGKTGSSQDKPLKVKTFVEKPDAALAQVFIGSGEFFWNSGMFVWKASVIRSEMERYLPQMTNLFKGWDKYLGTSNEAAFIERVYADMMRVSIDIGVMERTDNAWLFPAAFTWADIGNWESFYDNLSDKDEDGNSVKTSGKLLLQEDKNSVIYSGAGNKLVVVKGLEDYIVIDTDDILMICPRDDNKIKEVISQIGMPEYEEYR